MNARVHDPALFKDAKSSDFADTFQCVICSYVLENPVELECSHTACRDCMTRWLARSPTCPTCKTRTNSMKPSHYLEGRLASLDMHCPNTDRGCTASLLLGKDAKTILSHLEVCKYEYRVCVECKDPLPVEEWRRHQTRCPSKWVECKSCEQKIHPRDMDLHTRPDNPLLTCTGYRPWQV